MDGINLGKKLFLNSHAIQSIIFVFSVTVWTNFLLTQMRVEKLIFLLFSFPFILIFLLFSFHSLYVMELSPFNIFFLSNKSVLKFIQYNIILTKLATLAMTKFLGIKLHNRYKQKANPNRINDPERTSLLLVI